MIPTVLAALPWRRILPVVAVAAALAAVFLWGRSSGHAAAERACAARLATMERQARAREAAMQAQADAAAGALAAARDQAARTSERVTHEVRTYYRDRPAAAAVECLPADRVRAANADRAAIAAAAGGSADPVPADPAARPADR